MEPTDQAVWELAQAVAQHGWRANIDRAPDGNTAVYVGTRKGAGVYAVVQAEPGVWKIAWQRFAGKTRWQTVGHARDTTGVIAHIEQHTSTG